MDVKKQIKAIRDSAFQLNHDCNEVFHAEGGIRGEILANCPEFSSKNVTKNDQILEADEIESFFSRFLCTAGKPEDAICNGYIPGYFNFEAATSKVIENNKTTEARTISVVFGDPGQIEKLARLIASPITKYLREHFNKTCGRKDSYFDMPIAITEWIYMMYEIGSEVCDPNFERCYCLINAFDQDYLPDDEGDMLSGYSDTIPMTIENLGNKNFWNTFWNAAKRQELAYSKMGTDLFMASRIALDHLLEMNDVEAFIQSTEQKMLERSLKATDSKIVVNGFMGATQFAELYDVDAEALRKRLERIRIKNAFDSDLYVESENRGNRKAKYLYNPKRVIHIIEDMKS